MIKKIIISVSALMFLPGCASAVLVPVEYPSVANVTSDIPFRVSLNTGKVGGYGTSTMVFTGGIFVPVNSGPAPELHFGAEDQKVFAESLRSEIRRLGILGMPSDRDSANNVDITIYFVQTEHYPQFHEYKLTVALVMEYRDIGSTHSYEVLSSEGDALWTKMNTNASQGKLKAATKLLERVISDIEAFVGQVLRFKEEAADASEAAA